MQVVLAQQNTEDMLNIFWQQWFPTCCLFKNTILVQCFSDSGHMKQISKFSGGPLLLFLGSCSALSGLSALLLE